MQHLTHHCALPPFYRCCERNTQIFFHFSELLPELASLHEDNATNPRRRLAADRVPRNGQEVSFAVLEPTEKSAGKSNIKAVRVLPLPRGSVGFHSWSRMGVCARECVYVVEVWCLCPPVMVRGRAG